MGPILNNPTPNWAAEMQAKSSKAAFFEGAQQRKVIPEVGKRGNFGSRMLTAVYHRQDKIDRQASSPR